MGCDNRRPLRERRSARALPVALRRPARPELRWNVVLQLGKDIHRKLLCDSCCEGASVRRRRNSLRNAPEVRKKLRVRVTNARRPEDRLPLVGLAPNARVAEQGHPPSVLKTRSIDAATIRQNLSFDLMI